MKHYKITENNITYDITEYDNGDKYWHLNDYHRENGPAIESGSGDKFWFKYGLRHRTGGPAIEWANGDKEYWYNNKYLNHIHSDKELIRYIKLLSIY